MDAPDPDKTGFIVQTWHWAVTGLLGILAWIGKDVLGRIKRLEEKRLTKEEFEKQSAVTATELAKARHDLRNDLQRIASAIEIDRSNLRQDLNSILGQQKIMGEDIAEIKGRMK